ncbi:MAG: GDP-mannose 4,6-dehydratase [Armatimonadetes bacterium]|nr:GDP-mannose 4,6-dehydratase [Armatimonadota bacterium]
MTSLITGGAGFIGSYLAELLRSEGDQVILLDDLSTGRRENVAHLLDAGGVELVEGTILDADLVREQVARADRVFHLAAAVGVKLVMQRPLHTINVNLLGTHHVLDAAAELDKPTLLASSSEAYGDQAAARFQETTPSVLGPIHEMRWIYGLSKFADEYLPRAYAAEKGLQAVGARFFNTSGPRQTGRYGMVVPRFVQQALKGEPLTVFGDGKQVRCFCHVRDTARACKLLIEAPHCMGETFNVGTREAVTIEQLAETIIQMTGSSSRLEYVPYEQAYGVGIQDIRFRVPDTSKIKEATGFEPRYSLEDILGEVIEYYRSAEAQA